MTSDAQVNGSAANASIASLKAKAAAASAAAAAVLPAEAPAWTKPLNSTGYKPSHPGAFHVVFQESAESGVEAFSSKLVVDRAYGPGEQLAPISASQAPVKAYSSVQYGTGPHDHFEFHSDLLFMNHSCEPSAEMILVAGAPDRWEVRVGPKALAAGDEVTFFYPSSEWDMAQGFDCGCGKATCVKHVTGAKDLSLEELEAHGYVNEHIRVLKAEQALLNGN